MFRLLSSILILVSCFLSLVSDSLAQGTKKHTISGYVKEESTGEYMIGVNVYIKELTRGAATNQYGFYSLTIEEGEYTLATSYIGMQEYTEKLVLNEDKRINISLKSQVLNIKEVVISGEAADKNVKETQMGTFDMPIETIKSLPAFMGEVDVLKVIQLLPGVKNAGEGNTGFYVRGGGPDQNLILLDEAVVYNAAHLFGFFSVFNSDALKNVELIKGGMPANYGGRLASVLDISMKEGNSKKFQVDGGIGIISSRLTIQGPIKKDTASFIISGRRTYADILAKPFVNDTSPAKGSGYYFYDLNAKINYRLSDKDRIFLSGYFGRDVFMFKNNDNGFSAGIEWGNATTSLRWNHLYNDKLFVNTSLIFSDYQFEFSAGQEEFEGKFFSGIRDWNVKIDYNWLPDIRHNIKFGLNYIYHTFTPTSASARSGEVNFDLGKVAKLYAHDAALYIADDFDLTEKLRINAGLRATYFEQIGPFDRYVKNENNVITDTIHYTGANNSNPLMKLLVNGGLNQSVQVYRNIEPRLLMRYTLGKTSSVKASFTMNYQYIHLASYASVSLPTDIWVPSSSLVKPQRGIQYSVGYFRNFFDDVLETSVEVYYKTMKNQVEYKDGALPGDNVLDNPDNNMTFGDGKAYGIELFIKKAKGKFTGWIGYTLARTTRTFPTLNFGEEFEAKYDRRHDVSVIASYDITERLNVSAIFVYSTGNKLTIPVARYIYEGDLVNDYGARNAYRMPAYHRADLSVTYKGKQRKRFQGSWNLSIYNVYSRQNPFFIYFDADGTLADGSLRVVAKQVSLFPILPSITYNFKF